MNARRLFLMLCVLAPMTALAADPPATDADGFVPLFNGKDLTGWVSVNVATGTDRDTFTVKDGLIVCTGVPTGVMRTEKMYENFVAELEWRHMTPKGNSGFFLFADAITARGVPFARGLEVQILDGPTPDDRRYTTQGDLFPIHGATAKPDHPGKWSGRSYPIEDRTRPSPEWNHYRVEAKDGTVTLAINGKVVNSTKDVSPRRGYLCLESEGGRIHFRNIKIKELPPSENLDPKHVATADEGFKSLYTGVDLTGWSIDDRANTAWKPKDWILAFAVPEQAKTLPPETLALRSTRKFKAAELILDFRQPTAGRLPLSIGGTGVTITPPPVAAAPAKPTWRRLHLTFTGPALTASVDGVTVHQSNDPARAAREDSLVLNPAAPTDFANIYVKPLP